MAGGESGSEAIVKAALEDFLKQHGGEASLSYIDEIVLSYMVSVLEELAEDNCEDAFDVESFTEMMKEFMPEFDSIDSIVITEWMFQLSSKLNDTPQNGYARTLSFIPPQSAAISIAPKKTNTQCKRTYTTSDSTNSLSESSPSSVSALSSSTSLPSPSPGNGGGGCDTGGSGGGGEEMAAAMGLLTEMFPAACSMELSHCLSVAHGEVEMAAQLVLHRQEAGEGIQEDKQFVSNSKKSGSLRNDADMKKHIVARYSFVDTEDDKRDHRPTLPKKESKKLVRYLDSRVVSTKGERFTEIKKSPEEEEKMKKTFVSLKPAKQYRFH